MSEHLTISRKIINLKKRYDLLNIQISELITERETILGVIRSHSMQLKTIPIHLDSAPSNDYSLGQRCWICNKPSYYRCFICYEDNKPCGYCDNHTHRHKREYPHHNAIMQRIFQLDKPERKPRVKMTPEQALEYYKQKIKELESQ